jgi:hypothetical protein
MPTQQRLVEMQDDLAYKEQQMKNAENTHERLGQARCMRIGPNVTLFAHSDTLCYHRQELELRNMELEKINTLDTKINVRSLISEASQRNQPPCCMRCCCASGPAGAVCTMPCPPVPRMHHRRARHGGTGPPAVT